MDRVSQGIGLRLRARIEEVAAVQTISNRDPVIQTGDEVVLGGSGGDVHVDCLDPIYIGCTRRGRRPQCQIGLDGRDCRRS